jgi:hypothetical protein
VPPVLRLVTEDTSLLVPVLHVPAWRRRPGSLRARELTVLLDELDPDVFIFVGRDEIRGLKRNRDGSAWLVTEAAFDVDYGGGDDRDGA